MSSRECVINLFIYKKSITPDNVSEFWRWKDYSKSIHNNKDDIAIFFTHSYCSWEKCGIENFNGSMRRKYPKGTDFTNVTQKEINAAASWANGIFRESLDYYSADEMYNLYVSNQVETLPPLT